METNEELISELTLKYSRDINLLLDDKRPVVIGSLNSLTRLIENKSIELPARLYFFENRILKNFLAVLDSNSDSVRESSLRLVEILNQQLTPEQVECKLRVETQDILLRRILSRVSSLPFKEPIEEIRLFITKLLLKLITNFAQALYQNMSDVVQACVCLLQDKYPENKKEVCSVIMGLSVQNSELFGMSCRKILIPLLANCSHSHSKVRKVSLETMGKLLVLPKAGDNLKEVFEGIKALADDKNSEIREEAYKTLGLCLEHFGFADVKQYETQILAEIFSALDDESEKVRNLGQSILRGFASRRKVLFEKYNS